MNHSHYPAFRENLNVTFLELYRRLAQTTSSSKRYQYHPTIASSVGSTVPLNEFLEQTENPLLFAGTETPSLLAYYSSEQTRRKQNIRNCREITSHHPHRLEALPTMSPVPP